MIFGVELHKVDKLSNEWKDSPFWTGTVSAEGYVATPTLDNRLLNLHRVNKINWNDINCVTMMYMKPDTIHFTTKVSLTSAGEPVNRHFEFLLLLQTIEFLPYIGVFNDQAGQTTIFIITPDEAREIVAKIEPEATKPNCSNRGVCTCILNAVETKKVVLFTSDDLFNGDHVKLFSDPDDRDHLLKISFNKTQVKKFPRWEGDFCCDRRTPVMADDQKIEKMRCFFDLLFY